MKTKKDIINLTLRQRIDILEKVLDGELHSPLHPNLIKTELDKIGHLLSTEKDTKEIKYVLDKIVQIYAKLSIEESKKNNIDEIILEVDKFDDTIKVVVNSMFKISVKTIDRILKQHDEKYIENITGIGFSKNEIKIVYNDNKLPLIIELRCTGKNGQEDARECQKEFLEFLRNNSNNEN